MAFSRLALEQSEGTRSTAAPKIRQIPRSSQLSALGQDLSTLQNQAQQSPVDQLKTTPEVQQDINEGKSLTVF